MKSGMRKSVLAVLAIAVALPTGAAAAQKKKLIDVFDDWSAFAQGEGAGRVCYAGTIPKKSEGAVPNRGAVHVMVTHRPGEKRVGEVSITAGYAYKPNEPVVVEIDGQKYDLFTQGDTAWAADKERDAKLTAAMRRSAGNMIVRGTPTRGAKTVDTYSLAGFTAAWNAIGAACGIK